VDRPWKPTATFRRMSRETIEGENTVKRLIAALLLSIPVVATADHADVIEFKLTCDFNEYMAIVQDFNAWGKDHGYQTEIAVKHFHPNPGTLIWAGRSANAKTFGKAWDAWRNAMSDPESVPSKLNARFAKCSDIVSRRSYDVY